MASGGNNETSIITTMRSIPKVHKAFDPSKNDTFNAWHVSINAILPARAGRIALMLTCHALKVSFFEGSKALCTLGIERMVVMMLVSLLPPLAMLRNSPS